ncbi:MAG: hypothetical protein WCG04_03130 [Alphaproteobacteria bacterium]
MNYFIRWIFVISTICGVAVCSSHSEQIRAVDAKKKEKKQKCTNESQQSIAKENLVARCLVVRKGIASMLTRNGLSPASHPLIIQIERLLAELAAAPQVDALLLLQAGQCDGIGEAALALLPDSPPQLGIDNPSLRPPSSRRSPTITDEHQHRLLVKKNKERGRETAESTYPTDGGVYSSSRLPAENKEKDLLP